jgi:hypothetical protein
MMTTTEIAGITTEMMTTTEIAGITTEMMTTLDMTETEIVTALVIETKRMMVIMTRILEQVTTNNQQTMEVDIYPIDTWMKTITEKIQNHMVKDLVIEVDPRTIENIMMMTLKMKTIEIQEHIT